jgi:hypothetical protein
MQFGDANIIESGDADSKSLGGDGGLFGDVDGRTVPSLDLQMVNSRAGGNNVHDRVNGPNLVKVNLVDGNVMNLCLGVSQQFEGADGGLLDWSG